MKVLQLCTKVPYPPKDGGALGVYMYSKTLVNSGHTVNILAVNSIKHFHPENIFTTHHNVGIHSVNIDTQPKIFKAIQNVWFSKIPYQVERFNTRNFESYLTDLLQDYSPDIVQIEGIYLASYIPAIRKCSNACIVIRCHNIEHALWAQIAERENNWLKKFFLKLQIKRLKSFEISSLSLADAVITFTEPDMEFLKQQIPKLFVSHIPFGIEVDNTVPAITPKNKAIAFIGALDWNPNQKALMWFLDEVWPSVVQKFPGCVFHVAGRNAPQWLSEKLSRSKNVHYHGEIDDTKAFYSLSNIIVVPLFSAGGVRIKIIEGMNLGKVVVTNSIAMKGIPASPGFHYCLANTANEFISQLESLLNADVAVNEQYSMNAKKLIAENFDISVNTIKLCDLYHKITHA